MDGSTQKKLFDIFVALLDIFVAIGRDFVGNLIENSIGWGKHRQDFLLFVFVFILQFFACASGFVLLLFIPIRISKEQYGGHGRAPKRLKQGFLLFDLFVALPGSQ